MVATFRANSGIPLTASGGSSLITAALTANSIWVPVPAGLAVGDLMLMFLGTSYSGSHWTPPTATGTWTAGVTGLIAGNDDVDTGACYWKIATSSDVSASGYSVAVSNHTSNVTALGSIVAYSLTPGIRSLSGTNADIAGNVNSATVALASNTASQAAPTVPGGALGGTDLEVVCFIACNDTTGGASHTMTDTASTNGWTARHTLQCTKATSYNLSLFIYEKLAAADHPTTKCTVASGVAIITLALSAVLNPAQFMPFFGI